MRALANSVTDYGGANCWQDGVLDYAARSCILAAMENTVGIDFALCCVAVVTSNGRDGNEL